MQYLKITKRNGSSVKGVRSVDKKKHGISEQKKILSRFGVLFIAVFVSIIVLFRVYVGVCKRINNDIGAQENSLRQIKHEINDIKNSIDEWHTLQEGIKETNYDDKRSFVYKNVRIDEIIFEIDRKMSEDFNVSNITDETDKTKKMIVGNFQIDIKPLRYNNITEMENFIKKMFFDTKSDFEIMSNSIKVTFTTTYESTVYRMVNFFKQVFPGFIIVKHISIYPATSASKTMYYDLKFKHKDISNMMANSLKCEIYFDWIVLSKKDDNEIEM